MNAEKNKNNESVLVIADIKEQDCPIEKILQDELSELTEISKKDERKTRKSVVKN